MIIRSSVCDEIIVNFWKPNLLKTLTISTGFSLRYLQLLDITITLPSRHCDHQIIYLWWNHDCKFLEIQFYWKTLTISTGFSLMYFLLLDSYFAIKALTLKFLTSTNYQMKHCHTSSAKHVNYYFLNTLKVIPGLRVSIAWLDVRCPIWVALKT